MVKMVEWSIFGRFRLDELEHDAEKIEQWLRELEKKDYAFYSIRNAYQLVRRALKVAVARDKIRKNPTDTSRFAGLTS